MTELLKRAVQEASKLPEDRQNAWAEQLLSGLDDGPRRTTPELEALIAEARAERDAGLTRPLDELLD